MQQEEKIQPMERYIAVDLETTGLNPKQDKIMEIGAVRIEGGQEIGRFQTLVNPHRKLEPEIAALTGITQDMVDTAPETGDIFREWLDFCGNLPLLGHKVIFDYSFLKRAAVNLGYPFERDGVDTLKLCRMFMPGEQRKNLEAACGFFRIGRQGAHRALGDAQDAARLFETLKNHFAAQQPEAFVAKPLQYKVKREQPASKKQKEDLRDLLKYHKIDVPVQIEYLSRNEISRMKDKIISQYGRIMKL